jgi:predicted DCC family thiol-disulfide oxidoreductase YuxK
MKNYPIIIYDSSCYFCVRTLQIMNIKLPVTYIGTENLRSIKFIVNKQKLSGAFAVINIFAYNNNPFAKKMIFAYKSVPFVAPICESIYYLIAKNRQFLSKFL